MNPVTKAMYELMSQDEALIDIVGTLNGLPAVFSAAPIRPDDEDEDELRKHFPMAVLEGPTSDVPFGSKVSSGREMLLVIGCYALKTGSVKEVDDLATRVHQLFRNNLPAVEGCKVVLTTIESGPVESDSDRVYGRIIVVRVIVEDS